MISVEKDVDDVARETGEAPGSIGRAK